MGYVRPPQDTELRSINICISLLACNISNDHKIIDKIFENWPIFWQLNCSDNLFNIVCY